MTLDDDKVLVKVDEDRGHDVFVGPAPDDAAVVTMTMLVPNATMHLRMSPAKALDLAETLIAFAKQANADADGQQFHRGSRA